MNPSRIAIIGAGKVGTVLATLLTEQGYSVIEVMSRTHASAERLAAKVNARIVTHPRDITAEIILLTVSDRSIADVALQFAHTQHSGRILLHTSGATGIDALAPAHTARLHTGSIHPLFSFARDTLTRKELRGTYYAIDGDAVARATATELALSLGGKPFTLAADKRALYHASAVCASNYLVTLLLASARQLTKCGLSEEDSLAALLPLAFGTLENLSRIGMHALTGPIARGDTTTIDKHLHTLGENLPDLVDFYSQLGIMTADIAHENHQLSTETQTIIHQLLRRDIHEQTR